MNADIYLFGELGGGYTQYPDDYTKSIFYKFAKQTKSRSQMLVHRNDNAVYYAYIRRLTTGRSSDKYIGICYTISGKLIKDYKGLFKIFEEAITAITVRGQILEFTSVGEISSKVTHLYNCKAETVHLSNYLQSQLNSLDHSLIVPLSPLNYSVNTTETKVCAISDTKTINSSIGIYSYVIICKDEDIDTDSLRSYSNLLKENSKRISELEQANYNLQNECKRLERVEKRFKTVAWLSIIIVIISIILINVASTSSQRAQTISSQVETIGGLETKVGNLYIDSARTHTTLKETANKLGNAQELIEYKNDTLAGLRERNMSLKESLDYTTRQLQEQKKIVKEQSDLIQQRTLEIRSLKKRLENESFNPKGIDIQIYEGNRVKYLYSTSPWDIDGIDKRWKIYQLKVYYNGNLQKSQQIRIKR